MDIRTSERSTTEAALLADTQVADALHGLLDADPAASASPTDPAPFVLASEGGPPGGPWGGWVEGLPLEAVWQSAVEQLLTMAAGGVASPELLSLQPLLQLDDMVASQEPAADDRPQDEPRFSLAADESISLDGSASSSLLDLSERDLFGEGGPLSNPSDMRLLASPADQLLFELFGNEVPETDTRDQFASARPSEIITDAPPTLFLEGLPPHAVPGSGVVSLLDAPYGLNLQPADVAAYADADGNLLLIGNDDDFVTLTNGWVPVLVDGMMSDTFVTLAGDVTLTAVGVEIVAMVSV